MNLICNFFKKLLKQPQTCFVLPQPGDSDLQFYIIKLPEAFICEHQPLILISPWWSRLKQQTRCHPPHCLNVVSAIAAMACRLKSLRCSCPICSHIRPTVKWTAAFNLWNSNQVNQMNGNNIRYTVLLMCMNDTGAHTAVLG